MRCDSYDSDRDLLLGADSIADFVNSLVDSERPVTPKMIYAWIERKHLPVRRIGVRIVGSKTLIRAHLCGNSFGRSG
jgi:hypothetical protein